MSKVPGFDCMDCNVNTLEIDEYYMLQDNVWKLATGGSDGMLCFDCLRGRLGRALRRDDFIDCLLNTGSEGFRFAKMVLTD